MRQSTARQIQYTIEEFDFRGLVLTIEAEVDVTIEPYDAGDRFSPPSGGGIDELNVRIISATRYDEPEWKPTTEQLAAIKEELEQKFRYKIR